MALPDGFELEDDSQVSPPAGYSIEEPKVAPPAGYAVEKQNPPWYDNYLGLIRPILGSVQSGTASATKGILKAADFVGDKLGISRSNAVRKIMDDLGMQSVESLKSYAQENFQRGMGGIPGAVARGVGGAAMAIPATMALGPYAGLATLGGLEGLGEGDVKQGLIGAAQGALSGGALSGVGALPLAGRIGSMAGFGAATTPGGVKERLQGAITMGALGALGGSQKQIAELKGIIKDAGGTIPEEVSSTATEPTKGEALIQKMVAEQEQLSPQLAKSYDEYAYKVVAEKAAQKLFEEEGIPKEETLAKLKAAESQPTEQAAPTPPKGFTLEEPTESGGQLSAAPLASTISEFTPTETVKTPEARKLIEAIKNVGLQLGAQSQLRTAEMAKRFGEAREAMGGVSGRGAHGAILSKLAGQMPTLTTEGMANQLTPEETNNLFDSVKVSPTLAGDVPAILHGFEGLTRLLNGDLPAPHQLEVLNDVFGKELTDTILKQRPTWDKVKDTLLDISNLPRACMQAIHFTFGGKQGMFAAAANPKEFSQAFMNQFKYWGSQKAYDALRSTIISDPDYQFARRDRLALTNVSSPFRAQQEEPFRAEPLAEKIPGLGKVIKASNRGFSGPLIELRFNIYKKLLGDAEDMGLDPRNNSNLGKSYAQMVNTITGRGDLGKLQGMSDLLNVGFWSPRLMMSRINLLRPDYYIKQPPGVRQAVLKNLFATAATGAAVIAGAKLAGLKVGADPDNADFGKIRIGNTRIDIWGGFAQYPRTLYQVAVGGTTNADTGQFTKRTRTELLLKFGETKEAPLVSLATAILNGSKTFGSPNFDWGKEISNRFIPMTIQDIMEVHKENPNLVPLSLLNMFGLSVRSYSSHNKSASPDFQERLASIR